jgi:MFS family permease
LLCLACAAQALPSLAALLVGRIVFGVAFGVVWTSGMAWLTDLDEARGESAPPALGPAVTCSSVGIMLGPAVGGVLAQQIGLGAPFAVIAIATALIVVPPALGTRSARRAAPAPPIPAADLPLEIACFQPPVKDSPGAGGAASPRVLLALARHPRVAAAAGALVVSGAVSSASQLLVSGGLHRLGLSTGRIGLAFSVAAISYSAVSGGRPARRPGADAEVQRPQHRRARGGAGPRAGQYRHGCTGHGADAQRRPARGHQHAYNLASRRDDDGGSDGVVFGMLNGAWAAATVLMPLLAGAVEQAAGVEVAYLAVIIPSLAVAVWLLAGAAARVPVLRVGLRGWRGLN